MLKKYTITGFETHCRKRGYKSYKYTTDLQKRRSDDNLKIVLSFDKIYTCLSPDRVYIIGQCGLMCFQKVRYITQESQENGVDIFNIVCDDITNNNDSVKDIMYTIAAEI